MNEQEQSMQALTIADKVNMFIISNQQDYNNAAEVCKEIKAAIKKAEDEWAPLKSKAYEAWKGLCAKENEMLDKYRKAETVIKSKMTAFQRQKLEEEKILREEHERFRREEAERLMKAAEEAHQEGMVEHAEYLVEEAAKVEVMKFEQPKPAKTAGTAVKTVWKARIINEKLVPTEINGMLIRPIDMALINKLAANSKGMFKIPGIEFYEDVQVAVNRG